MLRSTLTRRDRLALRCDELRAERADLDPLSNAYKLKSLQIDAALSEIWALGPIDV